MLPVVAEIIDVGETRPSPDEIPHGHIAMLEDLWRVEERTVLEQFLVAKAQAAHPKLVQVTGLPVEGRLDHQMQLLEIPIDRQHDAPPDRRLDAVQGYVELDCVRLQSNHLQLARGDATPERG